MNCKYQYKETEDYNTLTISIKFDRYSESNQDELFNKVIKVISQIETNSSLSVAGAETINKFLSLARHSSNLDIRKFLNK